MRRQRFIAKTSVLRASGEWLLGMTKLARDAKKWMPVFRENPAL
jgi:hypothetical protein